MIPNNNLSVLPWYKTIAEQNARKWWVYGRIYPLYTPACLMPPFQIMRPSLKTVPTLEDEYFDTCPERDEVFEGSINGALTWGFVVGSATKLLIQDAPSTFGLEGEGTLVMGVAVDDMDTVLGFFDPVTTGRYTGEWVFPEGTYKVYVLALNDYLGSTKFGRFMLDNASAQMPTRMTIFKSDGTPLNTINYAQSLIDAGCTVKALSNYDVIVYPGLLPIFTSMENGQYYAMLTDGVNTWYSEMFTVVNDIEPYMKIEWWDVADFVMDAGTIVYTNPAFRNILYLQADIAKPEYIFEEEGETRDGYFFPVKQISEKRYRFSFLASEYLLDVMRFIRMADFAKITKNGQTYSLDTFLITPTWEDNGDVASVEAEFDTATVAKKIGLGYIKAQRGDFNDDFNEDYNN